MRHDAKSLALTILDASHDLRRRVPAALMARVNQLVLYAAPPTAAGEPGCVAPTFGDGGGDGDVGDDAELHDADAERGRKRVRRTAIRSTETGSFSSSDTTSDGDVFASEDDDFDIPPPVKIPVQVEWDKRAPQLSYGEVLDEPALATTGGVTGE